MGKISKVCQVSIGELVPYERNAKIHNEAQVEKIARSIQEFGFLNPVLIDTDKNIIAGHGRVLAAKKLGMASVPCLYIDDLTETQRRAYILADNKLAELAGWDYQVAELELSDLGDIGFDISLTGFDDANVGEADLDSFFGDAPEKEKKA